MTQFKDNSIIIECTCGTHLIKIEKIDNDEYYLDIYSQNFYAKQIPNVFKRMGTKLKQCFYILRGKAYRMEEFCLKEEDLNELQKGLQGLVKFNIDNFYNQK